MRYIILSLLLVCSTAFAEWKDIGFDPKTKEPVVSIDLDRSFIQGSVNYVFWKDYTYNNLSLVGNPNYHPLTVYRSRINCSSRTYSVDYIHNMSVRWIHDNRPIITESSVSFPGTSYSIADPGSAHEFVIKYVCGIR